MNRPPRITVLETRLTPALSVFYAGGHLTVTGVPAGELAINRAGATGFNVNVLDGTTNYGTYAVNGNIRLNLSNYSNDIAIDLGGGTLPGNLFVTHAIGNVQGRQNSTVVSIDDGGVGGSVVYTGGQGREFLRLGDAGKVTVGNDLRFTGRTGAGGDEEGNGLELTDAAVQRHLIASSAHFTQMLNASTVSGNLVSTAPASTRRVAIYLEDTAAVAGDVVVTGTSVADPEGDGDFFSMGEDVVIGGNVTLAFGDNSNGATIIGVVSGDLNVVFGSGAREYYAVNFLEVGGTVSGNLTAVFGNAVTNPADAGNLFSFEAGEGDIGTVHGNLSLNFGNGSKNDLNGFSDSGFNGTVHGDVDIRLGNAANFLTVNGTFNGGRFTYTGGSGADDVTIDGAYSFALTAHLGSGADTLTFAGGSAVGAMTIDFGVDFDTDEFDTTDLVSWPTVLLNLL